MKAQVKREGTELGEELLLLRQSLFGWRLDGSSGVESRRRGKERFLAAARALCRAKPTMAEVASAMLGWEIPASQGVAQYGLGSAANLAAQLHAAAPPPPPGGKDVYAPLAAFGNGGPAAWHRLPVSTQRQAEATMAKLWGATVCGDGNRRAVVMWPAVEAALLAFEENERRERQPRLARNLARHREHQEQQQRQAQL
eukprot:SAG11_NODE_2059_length_3874_cov_1.709139_3_plen_198_part_00